MVHKRVERGDVWTDGRGDMGISKATQMNQGRHMLCADGHTWMERLEWWDFQVEIIQREREKRYNLLHYAFHEADAHTSGAHFPFAFIHRCWEKRSGGAVDANVVACTRYILWARGKKSVINISSSIYPTSHANSSPFPKAGNERKKRACAIFLLLVLLAAAVPLGCMYW